MENLLAYFIVVLIFAIFFGIPFYLFYRWGAKHMTETETKVGTKNALICGAGLLIGLTAISLIMTRLSGQSFKISFSSSLDVFCLVAFIVSIVYWVRGHSLAGPLLLDCGPHRTSSHFRRTAGLGLIIGIWVFVQSISNGESRNFTEVSYWLTVSAYFFAMSYGRLQLRQNGIWQYWGLLRWKDVGSYHWEGQPLPTLVVIARRRFWISSQGAMSVPPHLKQQFDNILREHMSPNP